MLKGVTNRGCLETGMWHQWWDDVGDKMRDGHIYIAVMNMNLKNACISF